MSASFKKAIEASRGKLDYGKLLRIIDETSLVPSAQEVYETLHNLSLKTSSVHLTPSTAAKLMAQIGELYKPDKVLDLACGTGQLLYLCDYADHRQGVDIDDEAITLAKRLHPEITFEVADSTELREDVHFDLIISALPFGMRTSANGRSAPLEKVLLEKGLALLAKNGVMVALVPPNVLFAKIFESFRERVLGEFALDAVISLPGTMLKYTSVESNILVIRNGKPHQSTYFADYEQAEFQILANLRERTGDFQIPLERLESRWERNFYDPKYDIIESRLEGMIVRTIGEIADVTRGYRIPREDLKNQGQYVVLAPRDFRHGELNIVEGRGNRYINSLDDARFSRALLNPGDIIVGLIFEPAMYVYKDGDPPAVAGSNVAIIRSNENDYIGSYLSTDQGKKLFLLQVAQRNTGGTIRHLSMTDLRSIRIPIPPVSDPNILSEKEIQEASPEELVELREEIQHITSNLGGFLTTSQNSQSVGNLPSLHEESIPYVVDTQIDLASTPGSEILAQQFFAFYAYLDTRLSAIDGMLESISQTTSEILATVRSVNSQILMIKESPRSEDEKLLQIYQRLDTLADNVNPNSQGLIEYETIVRNWLLDWRLLEDSSWVFLTLAEYLFDSVHNIGSEDYSPFMIEYCRALENEILNKLFSPYHEDLEKHPNRKNKIVAADLADRESSANLFARYVNRNNCTYTMGQMSRILQLMRSGGRTLQGSDLLQDFRKFAVERFGNTVADKEFTDIVQDINDNYRNRSAHPNVLDLQTAQQCQPLVRQALSRFLALYNVSA